MEGDRSPMYQLLLGEVMGRNARKFHQKRALIWNGGYLDYGSLNARVNRLANSLTEMDVGRGDKVAMLLTNRPEIIETCYATFKIGAIAVPLNFRLAGAEVEYILNNSESKVLVVEADFVDMIKEILANVQNIGEIIVVGGNDPRKMKRYEELVEKGSSEEPRLLLSDNDDALILYTSGTTGRPKGAVISHKGFMLNAISWAMAYHTQSEDTLLCIPPLFHVASLGYTLTQFYLGAAVYIENTFDPERALRIIEREKITTLFLVPTMWIALLQVEDIESYDRSSLRILNTGAAIMPVEVKKKILKTFPNSGIFDCFGQTEMSGGVTILDARDALRKPGSVGKPVPFVEIRIVDGNGQELPIEEVGEAVYRGPTVMKKYYRNPLETDKAFRDGWFHSGDLLRQDGEGYYYVVDRKKDMIISGGENIYPAEVEEVLYLHPDVLEAAVIGVPDPDWGESVKAYVVPKSGASLTEKEVIEFCKTKLASYKKPKSVEFLKSLPKSASGKILKAIIRETFYGGLDKEIL